MTGIISTDVLLEEMDRLLGKEMPTQAGLSTVLDKLLDRLQCSVGTIHLLDPASGVLELRVQRGVPEVVLDRVRLVPLGKGMAGLAAERKQAVQVCNLQTDRSGAAKPKAKQTKMEGSIAVPMLVGERSLG